MTAREPARSPARRWWRDGPAVLLAALLGVVGTGGCSDEKADPGSAATTPSEGGAQDEDADEAGDDRERPSEGRPAHAVPPDPLDPVLGAALLGIGPPGWAQTAGPPGSGPLDLRAAARAEPDRRAERALLETRGFVRGHTRTWRGPDGEVAVATVYQFADPPGAAAYLGDGALTLDGFGAARFEVAAVPGALGFTSTAGGEEEQRVVHGVAFARAARFFLVLVSGRGSAVTPEDARALAGAQAALAPA